MRLCARVGARWRQSVTTGQRCTVLAAKQSDKEREREREGGVWEGRRGEIHPCNPTKRNKESKGLRRSATDLHTNVIYVHTCIARCHKHHKHAGIARRIAVGPLREPSERPEPQARALTGRPLLLHKRRSFGRPSRATVPRPPVSAMLFLGPGSARRSLVVHSSIIGRLSLLVVHNTTTCEGQETL